MKSNCLSEKENDNANKQAGIYKPYIFHYIYVIYIIVNKNKF